MAMMPTATMIKLTGEKKLKALLNRMLVDSYDVKMYFIAMKHHQTCRNIHPYVFAYMFATAVKAKNPPNLANSKHVLVTWLSLACQEAVVAASGPETDGAGVWGQQSSAGHVE